MVTLRNLTICFVVTLFSYATPSLCRELHFDSTDRYNIRWGNQEGDDDLVKCRHGLTIGYSFGPACFKKGSYITVSLVLDDTPEDKVVVDWHHVENGLYRAIGVDENGNPVTEETAFMSLPVQEQGQGVGKVFIMGPLPDWIEWCVLKVRVIFVHQGKQGRVGVSALHWCEIFTVLDEPKAPMNPAWVSVLRISCRWARGRSIWKAAVDKLRDEVFNNCQYDGSKIFHHFEGWQDTEIGWESTEETFHLKSFLSQPEPLRGNCNALTNFLCCLMNSVGINAVVQRTNRIVLENGNKVGCWTFRTKKIQPARWPAGEYFGQWGYHQIVLIETEGNRVWDGNLIFIDPLAIPSDMTRENLPPAGIEFGSREHWEAEGCETYFCKLVDFNSPFTDPNYRWETNHPNTKLSPPKLKVTTLPWENDGCF